jgi:hypothetical protein
MQTVEPAVQPAGDTFHTITALCQRSDAISREKGFTVEGVLKPYHTDSILFHSELSEALEEYRNNHKVTEVWSSEKGKPEGIPIELADFVIRICHRTGTDRCERSLEDAMTTRIQHYMKNPRDFSKVSFEEFLSDLHIATSLSVQSYHPKEKTHFVYLGRAIAECFLYCEDNGVNLWEAIDIKEAFNKTRPHMHGGKKI